MNPTSVLDTADWLLAIPVKQASGEALDFSGTALSLAFTPVFGGEPIATATSTDGSLSFVPGLNPYFAVNLPVANRTWRVSAITTVFGDVLRQPDPQNPLLVEWLGREALRVHPGSNSSGIASPASSPVLIPAQPYDGRLVMTPLVVGPQGAIDRSYTDERVAFLQGQLNAALANIDVITPSNLDFSRPAMTGVSPPVHRI